MYFAVDTVDFYADVFFTLCDDIIMAVTVKYSHRVTEVS